MCPRRARNAKTQALAAVARLAQIDAAAKKAALEEANSQQIISPAGQKENTISYSSRSSTTRISDSDEIENEAENGDEDENFFDTIGSDLDEDEIEDEDHRAEFQPKISLTEARSVVCTDETDRIPGLVPPLYPHQIVGIHEMLRLEGNPKIAGGILADEPGLGKTVQILGLIMSKYTMNERSGPKDSSRNGTVRAKRLPPTLIIAPIGLHAQWEREIREKTLIQLKSGRTRPLKVLVYRGSDRYRDERQFAKHDVVITNVQTAVSEYQRKLRHDEEMRTEEDSDCFSDYPGGNSCGAPLFFFTWGRLVIDEAHLLRNRDRLAAKSVFKITADHVWCLTGTPIINQLKDLYSLVKLSGAGACCDWRNFRRGIANVERKNPALACKKVQTVLQQFTIRRLKSSTMGGQPILKLPEIEEHVEIVTLDRHEQQHYTAVHKSSRITASPYIQPGSMIKPHALVLQCIMRMRQAVLHPRLLVKDNQKKVSDNPMWPSYEVGRLRITGGDFYHHPLTSAQSPGIESETTASDQETEPEPSPRENKRRQRKQKGKAGVTTKRPRKEKVSVKFNGPPSTKMIKILTIVRDIHRRSPSEKILIFSNFVGFLDLLASFLEESTDIDFARYDGGMSFSAREETLQSFSRPYKAEGLPRNLCPRVLLLSISSAGVGLNLTMANHVIYSDPHWNAALHSQSTARVHRIGQHRDVKIYHLIAKDTIEERMRKSQKAKQRMAGEALGEGMFGPLPKLTAKEIRYLLSIDHYEDPESEKDT